MGWTNWAPHITRQLSDLKIAPFYGCYIVRPTEALDIAEHPERQQSLEMLIGSVGATLVDFEGKTRCCGFPILTINERNSMAMVGKHTSEVKDLGADAMVTPCPLCHLNLGRFSTQSRQPGPSLHRLAHSASAPADRAGDGNVAVRAGT